MTARRDILDQLQEELDEHPGSGRLVVVLLVVWVASISVLVGGVAWWLWTVIP